MADMICPFRDPDIDTIISGLGGVKMKTFSGTIPANTSIAIGGVYALCNLPSGVTQANALGGCINSSGSGLNFYTVSGGKIYLGNADPTQAQVISNAKTITGVVFYT